MRRDRQPYAYRALVNAYKESVFKQSKPGWDQGMLGGYAYIQHASKERRL